MSCYLKIKNTQSSLIIERTVKPSFNTLKHLVFQIFNAIEKIAANITIALQDSNNGPVQTIFETT
jgi:hypothetical protein